ncbi:MAG: site-2 protease family protein [Candidatus Paceibacterota bacterium]|jgi:regulator of sigma E protease
MITLLLAIAALSLLMALHEFGHFLLAKLFNVKVEGFSIGLPPKIFSFKRGEVTYSLNAIPFGAFVKINEEENNQDKRSFFNQATSKKVAIFLGGVGINLIVAFIIFVLLFTIGFPKDLIPSNYQIGSSSSILIKYPVGQAIAETGRFLSFVLVESLKGLKIAFGKIFTGLDVSDLLGPVGLVAITSRSFEYGWRYGAYILGLISYSLAIFNLLPIPALDGGRLLFLFLGKIFRKPISQKTEALIDNITFALLMCLAVLVTIKDVRFFYFH